jgi:hypothetical protein
MGGARQSVQASDTTLIAVTALLAAIGSVLTAIVAAVALLAEGRRDRLSIGINNLWKLVESWDSPEMRLRRAHLAQRLRNEEPPLRETSDEAIDVLNTFELLGYLVRAKALSLEDAWINFSPWAVSWWFIYKPAIIRLQEEVDPTLFEDYARLVHEFIAYEARRRDQEPTALVPDADALTDFLSSEEGLSRRLAPAPPKPSLGERVLSWLERSWFSGPSGAGDEDSGGSGDPS